MPYVVTLDDFRPPPRADGIAFDRARIEEGPSGDGPWTALEVKALVPLDLDPAAPASRDFTTNLALLSSGWYRVVFLDPSDAEAPSDPVIASQPGVPPPDIAEVRARSPMLRVKYPAGSADPQVDADLRYVVQDAVALVESIACRKLSGDLPADLVPFAFRAVTLKAEQLAIAGGAQLAEQTAAGRRLRSISAGPWSESYFAPGELVVKDGVPQVDPDPRLHEALWALMDEECREAWLALVRGDQVPAGAVTRFDYRRMSGRGGGLRGVGPDGW